MCLCFLCTISWVETYTGEYGWEVECCHWELKPGHSSFLNLEIKLNFRKDLCWREGSLVFEFACLDSVDFLQLGWDADNAPRHALAICNVLFLRSCTASTKPLFALLSWTVCAACDRCYHTAASLSFLIFVTANQTGLHFQLIWLIGGLSKTLAQDFFFF